MNSPGYLNQRVATQSVAGIIGGGGKGSQGTGRERPGALLARRAPTMKRWSLDARSKGQPWLLPYIEV
jgi:hypothetical protein